MIIFVCVSIYCLIGIVLYFVVEPYLRIRRNFLFCKDDEIEQSVLRSFGSILWPIAIIIFPILKFILGPIYKGLLILDKKAEEFWQIKEVPKLEKSINEAKSDYRKISFGPPPKS